MKTGQKEESSDGKIAREREREIDRYTEVIVRSETQRGDREWKTS